MKTIEIKDTGPIRQLSIPIPENGGVVVLKARNGAGKSKSLEAADALVNGSGSELKPRDGSFRGEVTGFGAKLHVMKKTVRSGELEVVTLEGRLNVADLVDPGLIDPVRADATRIKALVQLSGAKSDPELFRGIFPDPETFQSIVLKEAEGANLATDDVVRLASQVKKLAEAAARAEDKIAVIDEAAAKAAKAATEGVDLNAQTDAKVLQANLEQAVRQASNLETQKRQADEAAARSVEAQEQLAKLSPPDLNALIESHKDAQVRIAACSELLQQRRRELDEAQQNVRSAEGHLRDAETAAAHVVTKLDAAKRERATIAACEKVIRDAADQQPPSFAELEAAQDCVAKAREAIETGALVRSARQKMVDAERFVASATKHRQTEFELRNAASKTDDVLSSLVARPGSPLRVENGRLVMETSRGTTYFSELSEGERWKVALDIAIDAVGPSGLLVIPQAAWEALDPINRQLIADHVRDRGVTILTAESSEHAEIVPELVGA